MVVAFADRGQRNEWWEGLEKVQVINVAKGKRGEWGILITHDRKCLCVIITICVTKISYLQQYISLSECAGTRVSVRSEIAVGI